MDVSAEQLSRFDGFEGLSKKAKRRRRKRLKDASDREAQAAGDQPTVGPEVAGLLSR